MEGPDGKNMLNIQELEELHAKYVESKLDETVLKDVSECQRSFFLYPELLTKHNIEPEKKK